MAHIFLHRNDLRFSVERENEILTDTTAAYLGLGVLILGGILFQVTKDQFSTMETQTRHFGYLTPDEFGYLLAKRHIIFRDDARHFLSHDPASSALAEGDVGSNENGEALRWLAPMVFGGANTYGRDGWQTDGSRTGLAPRPMVLNQGALGSKWSTSPLRVVFPCPVCYQNLRTPCHLGSIVVRCPVCRREFNCKT